MTPWKKKKIEQQAKAEKNTKREKVTKWGGIALAVIIALSVIGSLTESNDNEQSNLSNYGSSVVETQTNDPTEDDSSSELEELNPSSGDGLDQVDVPAEPIAVPKTVFSLSEVPAYSGDPYIAVNDNVPFFEDSELTTTSFETYSSLDSLGRCGVAYACVGVDLMPTEERGDIGQVKPTGWQTVRYDNVDGKYLYNRCHLIGYQLSGENANVKNLITGTRYMNVDGMLPFENMVADYVKETNNHVIYRVTPYFEGNNLLATGVLMEAKSVEDDGDGVLYNVFVYNSQPGIGIDYETGDSWLAGDDSKPDDDDNQEPVQGTQSTSSANPEPDSSSEKQSNTRTYVLNTNTKKFHNPSCSSVKQMNESNKQEYSGTRDEVVGMGYEPCGRCNP